jgi:IS30 family transposase
VGEAALMSAKPQPPAHTPKYRRLTPEQRALIRDLRKADKSQTEIAQIVGCDQSTVSKWLAELTDSTADASEYLRGQALPMAEKIVKRGRPSDLIKALQGVGVLQEERSAGLVVQLGIKDSDVTISLSPGETSVSERRSAESLRITTGSDKPSSVNQP